MYSFSVSLWVLSLILIFDMVNHQHTIILLVALLLVPSFLLWGMVRAAFKTDIDDDTLSRAIRTAIHEALKTASGKHPLF